MPPPTWQVDGKERFSKLVDFLRKRLGKDHVVGLVCRVRCRQRRSLHRNQTLRSLYLQFLYLREAFSPGLEERIQTLFDAFGVDGRLVVNYATVPAWG